MTKSETERARSKPADTRDALILAAEQLYAAGGFEAVTMRALGEKVGISHMTAYYYFRNKDELMAELRYRAFARFTGAMDKAAAGIRDKQEKLRSLCLGYLKFGLERPADYGLMFAVWEFEDYQSFVGTHGPEALRHPGSWEGMRDAVAAAFPDQADEAEKRAHLLWAGLHGLVELHQAHKLVFGMRACDLAEPLADMFIAAFRAETMCGKPES